MELKKFIKTSFIEYINENKNSLSDDDLYDIAKW
jgi:hypothetical protein